MPPTLSQLVDDVYAELWRLAPGHAVYLGRHEYDGVVPDLTAPTVSVALRRLQDLRGELVELADLGLEESIDRDLLVLEIDRTVFEWDVLRMPLRNPMEWVYHLDPDLYLKRHYAPAPHRAEVVARLLEGAPGLLATARDRIDDVVPAIYVEWGITVAEGLADMIEQDVEPAFPDLDDELRQTLRKAIGVATDELRGFVSWLRETRLPTANDAFAIGRDRFERLLEVSEAVTMSVEELREMAERDLESNLAAFRETAADIDPGLSPREVYDRYVASVHPEADDLVDTVRDMLEEIRDYIVDHDIVTIPSEVRAKVAETPRHLRWAFAMMDTPGPYEAVATDAYYYVTPVDPSWDAEQAEEWLKALNTFALEDISIHEAYPGHYVHFLHYQHAPTEVAKRFTSYAFVEGYAHYTEQMMWEEGFRAGDPRFRLAQLAEALVRNCRFVCAIGMHVDGMTVDEATQVFIDKAYYEETPARKEAERGTFDPGYFSYTLGKLQILALREEYEEAAGGDYSLKRFHDALLSRGAPPVPVLRRLMLGQSAPGQ